MRSTLRHIRFAGLVDLVDGRLSPADQAQIQSHLAICARCAAQAAWLERVIGLMRSDSAEDPPAYAIQRVLRMFPPRGVPEPSRLRQRVAALLRFDSAQAPWALGVRAGLTTARHLLFNAEGHDLDLRIQPSGPLWEVSGQVLGPEGSGQVELQGPTRSVRAALNELSEFRLPPVPAGSYTLVVHLADVEIEVGGLKVGP